MTYVALLVSFVNALLPVIPAPYNGLVSALLIFIAAICHLQSHTPQALGNAGYKKVE